jgi:AcrR family transcriptional regulator
MSPRNYRMGKREDAVRENRQRIIEAARALILDSGFHRASMVDVAQRAGVTRATVYYQFGSKLGLLEAVLTDALTRAGLERLIPLVGLPDAREALEASTRESTRLWAAEHELFRKLMGLALVDPEAEQVTNRRDAERRSAMEHLLARLRQQGYVRPGYSDEQALAVLTLATSFATFDSLYGASGLPVDDVAALLLDIMGVVVDRGG